MIKILRYKTFESNNKLYYELGTKLLNAVHMENYDKVKELLKYGADVNYRDQHGFSALMSSTYNDYFSITKLLLDAGADVNIIDDDNDTAIIGAIDACNIDSIILLLNSGAKLIWSDDEDKAIVRILAYNNLRDWINNEDTQRYLLNKEPRLIKGFIKNKFVFHPNIQKEFAHLITGDQLNLL